VDDLVDYALQKNIHRQPLPARILRPEIGAQDRSLPKSWTASSLHWNDGTVQDSTDMQSCRNDSGLKSSNVAQKNPGRARVLGPD
jgi:hypothetical protein